MKNIPAVLLLAAAIGSIAASPPQRRHAPAPRTAQRARPQPPPKLPCGDPLAFEVLLDRQGFSPGEIDGKLGPNDARALAAVQAARGLEPTGQADCDTWHALGAETSGPTTTTYTIEEQDVKGPFVKAIPRDLEKQASLPSLGYRSAIERIGEKFHAAPALLQRMNARVAFKAGNEISVPAVTAFDVDAKPPKEPLEADVTIQVSREESALRATRPDGTLIFFAPVTTGSEHDPLPVGDWKVVSVDSHPVFHYNPKLFWDGNPKHSKATLKPGPNNPVGVVWITLNLEHYGLHGTPEPSRIALTESHGCVRLTNWDAAHVAAIVKRGTPVLFR